MEPQKTLKVAIYIRVSDKEQGDKFGPQMQESACRSFINARFPSLQVAEEQYIYRDIDVSGSLPWHERDGMQRLFNDLAYASEENKPFDMVIVYKIDRFARSLKYLLDIIDEMKTRGVGFISANESIDTSTPFGNAMLGILGVFAELERSTIQTRMDDGYDMAVLLGSWMQDKYGYNRVDQGNLHRPVINQEQAEVIRKAFNLFVHGGLNAPQIARLFTEERILIPGATKTQRLPTSRIKDPYFWRKETIMDILRDEVYIGKYYHTKSYSVKQEGTSKKKQVLLPKEEWQLCDIGHESIIGDTLFQQAQELLGTKNGTFRTAKEPYMLSGLLKCDCCQKDHARGMMTRVGTQTGGKKIYQCKGKHQDSGPKPCPTTPLNKDDLEYIVLSQIKKIFAKPEVLEEYVKNNHFSTKILNNHQKIVASLKMNKQKRLQGIENLKEMVSRGDIGRQEYTERVEKQNLEIENIDAKLAEMQSNLAQATRVDTYVEGIKAIKDILNADLDQIMQDQERCRILLQIIVDHIVIYAKPLEKGIKLPGRQKEGQYRPYRIRIVFKFPDEFLDVFYDNPDDPDFDGSGGSSDKGKGDKTNPSPGKTDAKSPKNSIRNSLNSVLGSPNTGKADLLSKRDSFTGTFFVLGKFYAFMEVQGVIFFIGFLSNRFV